MTNLIGQSLGRYHILEQLGEGGMATVYKAYDTRLERDVAVKIIRRGAFPPEHLDRILKRFEREAKALAKLSHPNIVGVIDYGEYEGNPYLVMEYLPGGTLKKRLGTPIPWQEAIRLLLPIARALEFAHGQGIVHRDVKPSNILITTSGEPMLSDFGIAKILESGEAETLTGTGIGMGTPEYMAPEQWTGRVTAQSDVYSLGVVFYEMVTGRKPYVADTPAAILLKQASEPLPRPTKYVPDLPERVEKVLLKALARKPENRYSEMSGFVYVMEQLAVATGQRARGPTSTRSKPREDSQSTILQPISDTRATILQENDTEATRDQGTGAVVQPVSAPPAPQSANRSWRWLLPVGIGALIFVVVCLLVGVIGLMNKGPLAQNRSAAVSSTGEGLSSGVQQVSQETALGSSTDTSAPFSASPVPQLTGSTGKIVFTCQISGLSDYNEICIINADGSHFRQLTNNGANNGYASLSPDGQSIVYASNQAGTWQIYEMDLSTGSTRQLTFGPSEAVAPDISPDGRSIVYKHSDQVDSIWVMNRDGSNPHQVYHIGWDPAWSPDGRQILFASGAINQSQLYIINLDGSNLRQLTNLSDLRGRNDWSNKGLIASHAGKTGFRSIFFIHPDGSGLDWIDTGGDSLSPSFSPDGNWITFMSYRDNPGSGNGCEIYIMRLDGSDIQRLTRNNYCDWQPRWGP